MSDEHITIPRKRLQELQAAEEKLLDLRIILNHGTTAGWGYLVKVAQIAPDVKAEWDVIIRRVRELLE